MTMIVYVSPEYAVGELVRGSRHSGQPGQDPDASGGAPDSSGFRGWPLSRLGGASRPWGMKRLPAKACNITLPCCAYPQRGLPGTMELPGRIRFAVLDPAIWATQFDCQVGCGWPAIFISGIYRGRRLWRRIRVEWNGGDGFLRCCRVLRCLCGSQNASSSNTTLAIGTPLQWLAALVVPSR